MNWFDIKKDLEIKKINNLLLISDYRKDELIKYLEKIKDEKCDTEIKCDLSETNDIFLKPWNKLSVVQKTIKLKEFSKNISSNKQNQINMEFKLFNKLKNKELNNNDISYDYNNGKITSIKNLDSYLENSY